MNLNLLIAIPLITSLAILFCRDLKQVRIAALFGSLAQFVLCCILLSAFYHERNSGNNTQFLFEQNIPWFSSLNIYYHIGVDGISIAMLLLTACVVLAGVLVSWKDEAISKDSMGIHSGKEFFLLLTILSAGAYGFFIALDLFTMFFFLEVAVIPKFLLIGIWGSGKKEYSAMKLALMLMAGSAFVLVGLLGLYFNSDTSVISISNGIIYIQSNSSNFDLSTIAQLHIPIEIQNIFFPFLFLGFGIFTAIFPFHTWVPDGHSSAPNAGSMFLAGISMKLGGYGCLRAATYLMPEAAEFYQPIIITLSTIAIIYGAFATLMQTDLKYINAYSSVSHCGFVLFGIGMLNQTAINGAVMQMVSHGLMTALFFAAIGMLYARAHTRQVAQLGGLLKIIPFIGTVFIVAGFCSLGLPGMSGFVAEMTVFMGGWQEAETAYRIATNLACASIVVTAVYILRAIAGSFMGPIKNQEFTTLTDASWNEKIAAFILLAGIFIIGLFPFYINELIKPATDFIISKIVNGVL